MSRKAMGLIAAIAAVVGLMALAGSAHAQVAPGSVSIIPASQTVAPSATVTVDVVAEAPTGNLGTWNLFIQYDETVLELDTAALATCSPTVGSTCEAVPPNQVRVGGISVSGTGLAGTITLATLTFTAIGADGDQSLLDILGPLTQAPSEWFDANGDPVGDPTLTDGTVTLQVPTPTPTPSPTPLATPTPTPTTAATASPTRTATPAQLPATGGTASDGSGSDMAWVLGFLGLAVLAGGIWAVSRTRRESV